MLTPSDILKANGMEQWDVQIGSVIVIPKKKDAIPLKNIKRQAWWFMPALDYMSPVVRSEAQQMWDNIKTLQLRRWWASEGLDEWTAQDPKPPEQPYSYSSGLAHALAADLVYNILAEIRLPILLKQRALQEKIDDEIFRLKTINRFSGVANVGVGMIELAAATPCLLAPEPTMASKVAGGFLLWRSAEDFTVGGAKIWSGEDQGSITEQALANVIGGDAAKYTLLTADVASLSYAAAMEKAFAQQAGKIAASDLARVERELVAMERMNKAGAGTNKLYVHLTEQQYKAVAEKGVLGRGAQGWFIDEGRIWATGYSREQLTGVMGAVRKTLIGKGPWWNPTRTIALKGEAVSAFSKAIGPKFSINPVGSLKGLTSQYYYRGTIPYLGGNAINSMAGATAYTSKQMMLYRFGEALRGAAMLGSGPSAVWGLKHLKENQIEE